MPERVYRRCRPVQPRRAAAFGAVRASRKPRTSNHASAPRTRAQGEASGASAAERAGLESLQKAGGQQYETGAEDRSPYPSGHGLFMTHARLHAGELEDALLRRVVRRPQDQKQSPGCENESANDR